jgi:hypothetical protein
MRVVRKVGTCVAIVSALDGQLYDRFHQCIFVGPVVLAGAAA